MKIYLPTFPNTLSQKLRFNRTVRGAIPASIFAAAWFASGATVASSEKRSSAAPVEHQEVKVTTTREGEATHFFVENGERCEVTMTFEMALENLKGEASFPYTATFAPGKTTEAFTLSPIEPDSKWGYSYTNYYKLGSNRAQHEDSFLYQLPYEAGATFKVTQAYGGSFSHTGSNKYAIDWKMPEGTVVHAARGGLVVKVKDDSSRGGGSMKYDRYNNYVLIRHEDGTLGHYCHLQRGGCLVKPGQSVSAGDVIARSGNTGFSSGPHLHFCVFKTKDGRDRESIPVRFRTAEIQGVTLREGETYKAGGTHTAAAVPDRHQAQAQGGVIQ